PSTPAKPKPRKASEPYERALRTIPWLCISGFIVVVISFITRKPDLTRIGTALFLSGFAVWGLVNGVEMIRRLVKELRGQSSKEKTHRPWGLFFGIAFAGSITGFGVVFAWGV